MSDLLPKVVEEKSDGCKTCFRHQRCQRIDVVKIERLVSKSIISEKNGTYLMPKLKIQLYLK